MSLQPKKKSIDVERAVAECHKIATEYIRSWKPINSKWKTISGAAYLRLSTDEQVAVEKGSLEQQVYLAIMEAESRSQRHGRNYRITKFYIEPGISGTRTDRKEFLALKRAIRHKDFEFVAFKEISRISRDVLIWKEFIKLCHGVNCEIVIRGFPIDLNDPAQLLQLDFLALFAEYEAKVTAKRIRESVYSAMINSGKFNATHRILGLEPLIVAGEKRVGFYQANNEELTLVRWIMESFVKYGSHQKVIELCKERGVKNWTGKPFQRHSLINLLTNTRYIGKWYLNEENRLVKDHLPDHKRFREIDLPHGPVIPIELWHQVQTVASRVAGNLGKNTRVDRVYPLSGGLLRYHDGSSFRGCSGTGKTTKSYYYFNETNGLRIPCAIVEDETVKMVGQVVRGSQQIQEAIKTFGAEAQDKVQFHEQLLKDLRKSLQHTNHRKQEYLQKMSILIGSDATPEEIKLFKDEFKMLLTTVNDERVTLEEQIQRAEQDIKDLRGSTFSWAEIESHISSIQEILADKDPVALKRAYHALFKAIVIGPEEENGNRNLVFILKNSDELLEDEVRLSSEVVEAGGIEPPSASDPR